MKCKYCAADIIPKFVNNIVHMDVPHNIIGACRTVILQQKHVVEISQGHWTGPNGCCLLSELRRRHHNSILNSFLFSTYFHDLLSLRFVTFSGSLAFVSFWLFCLLMSIVVGFFVLDLRMKYIVEVVPLYSYIVWFVVM